MTMNNMEAKAKSQGEENDAQESRKNCSDEEGERASFAAKEKQDDAVSQSSRDEEENYLFLENDDDAKEEADHTKKNQKALKEKKGGRDFDDKFLKKTENFNDKLRKRGVIYVARIPPKMTATKVKSLLSEFGEITRVYLVEEDKAVRQRRRKQGGSGAKRYTEGWVEFAKKKIAKNVAQSLNNTPISNYKRSSHYGDLWNLKYLHKFKWSHLTEKVAYERRVREQKLRVEMMQARRENANYVELVETGKKLDKIEERKRKRMKKEMAPEKTDTEKNDPEKKPKKRQTQPLDEKSDSTAKKALLQTLVLD